jgi:hypothetical protein
VFHHIAITDRNLLSKTKIQRIDFRNEERVG